MLYLYFEWQRHQLHSTIRHPSGMTDHFLYEFDLMSGNWENLMRAYDLKIKVDNDIYIALYSSHFFNGQDELAT